mmetsp:Transcript_2787/g.5135  ORF Transcript_2787/g.5135 Transcript_2787/m.5135 type:complete len:498 (+) Transcript_2787:418-1911(+)
MSQSSATATARARLLNDAKTKEGAATAAWPCDGRTESAHVTDRRDFVSRMARMLHGILTDISEKPDLARAIGAGGRASLVAAAAKLCVNLVCVWTDHDLSGADCEPAEVAVAELILRVLEMCENQHDIIIQSEASETSERMGSSDGDSSGISLQWTWLLLQSLAAGQVRFRRGVEEEEEEEDARSERDGKHVHVSSEDNNNNNRKHQHVDLRDDVSRSVQLRFLAVVKLVRLALSVQLSAPKHSALRTIRLWWSCGDDESPVAHTEAALKEMQAMAQRVLADVIRAAGSSVCAEESKPSANLVDSLFQLYGEDDEMLVSMVEEVIRLHRDTKKLLLLHSKEDGQKITTEQAKRHVHVPRECIARWKQACAAAGSWISEHLNPHDMMQRLVKVVGYDASVFLDWLVTGDADFLSCILRYSKLLASEPRVAVGVLGVDRASTLRLTLEALHGKVDSLSSKGIFPYNARPLIVSMGRAISAVANAIDVDSAARAEGETAV